MIHFFLARLNSAGLPSYKVTVQQSSRSYCCKNNVEWMKKLNHYLGPEFIGAFLFKNFANGLIQMFSNFTS